MSDHVLNALKDYYQRGKNVLLIGERGVGKTSLVLQVAKELGIGKVTILSGSTIDPFYDLTGIPRPYIGEDGVERIRSVRPDHFDEETELLFIDELNRSHERVRNAVLELIQFGSINGNVLPNLKAVWAAINPSTNSIHDYDVQELDEAQKDRFHFQIHLPYEPSRSFFTETFDSSIADAVMEFWDNLADKKKDISPRRLEYAIDTYLNYPATDMMHVFNDKVVSDKFKALMKSKAVTTVYTLKNQIKKISEESDQTKKDKLAKALTSSIATNWRPIENVFKKPDPLQVDFLSTLIEYLPEGDYLNALVQITNTPEYDFLRQKSPRLQDAVLAGNISTALFTPSEYKTNFFNKLTETNLSSILLHSVDSAKDVSDPEKLFSHIESSFNQITSLSKRRIFIQNLLEILNSHYTDSSGQPLLTEERLVNATKADQELLEPLYLTFLFLEGFCIRTQSSRSLEDVMIPNAFTQYLVKYAANINHYDSIQYKFGEFYKKLINTPYKVDNDSGSNHTSTSFEI